jgi:hypothetical protein
MVPKSNKMVLLFEVFLLVIVNGEEQRVEDRNRDYCNSIAYQYLNIVRLAL